MRFLSGTEQSEFSYSTHNQPAVDVDLDASWDIADGRTSYLEWDKLTAVEQYAGAHRNRNAWHRASWRPNSLQQMNPAEKEPDSKTL